VPTFESIRRTLSSLQNSLRTHLIREAGLLGLGLLFLVSAFAVLFTHLGLSAAKSLLLATLSIPLGGYFWFRYRKPEIDRLESVLETARFAQILEPSLGTGPSSAVEFSEELVSATTNAQFSESLARAHVEQTAHKLSQVSLEERVSDYLGGLYRWAPLACGAALLVSAALITNLDAGRTRLVQHLSGDATIQISELPLVGDMRLTYNYPSYTGLSPRVIEGSDGRIETLRATQVLFEAVADEPVEAASLVLLNTAGKPIRTVPATIKNERQLQAQFSVMENGRYHVALTSAEGDQKRGRREYPIVVQADAHPTISMDTPASDVEIKQTESVQVLWRARDDFAVSEVALIVESSTGAETGIRTVLAGPKQKAKAREGRYTYRPGKEALGSDDGVVIYLEAIDNDPVTGPKRTTSARRKITIFSARRNHARVQAQLQGALDKLVDLLASELVSFAAASQPAGKNMETLVADQKTGFVLLQTVYADLTKLAADLSADTLSAPDTIAAFKNTQERVAQALSARENAIKRQEHVSSIRSALNLVTTTQSRFIPKLENDIAYLDDLLALGRIQDLKQTAADLLSNQKELQGLLDAFRNTQDPKLKQELEARIESLRKQMLELLNRMSQIKKTLPGEYRNMESASMLKVDDQLGRLEEMLKSGDLEGAAQELEQLANMIEQMVESIDDAGESYGGEKYDELRENMEKFAQEFEGLEQQQKALKTRTDEMVERYRERAMKKAGKNPDALSEKLLGLIVTAQGEVDFLATKEFLSAFAQRQLTGLRERLMDLQLLIEQKDFSESLKLSGSALQYANNLRTRISRQTQGRNVLPEQESRKLTASGKKLVETVQEIRELLEELFPDPEDVLTQDEMQDLQQMAQKQDELHEQAGEVGQRMQELAQEVPLFGSEPMQMLQAARQEMKASGNKTREGQLPQASHHGERALEQLKKMRQAFEQSSQGQGQGIPLPLSSQMKKNNQKGQGRKMRSEDVELPGADTKAGGPSFREELLDAAKQDAPQNYEEAVRKYYQELIK
jgi:hypothetical protein